VPAVCAGSMTANAVRQKEVARARRFKRQLLERVSETVSMKWRCKEESLH
jgi:hypothetical protein